MKLATLVPEVLRVLGQTDHFLSSYQIFDEIDPALRQTLRQMVGHRSGRHSGNRNSCVSWIGQTCRMLVRQQKLEVAYQKTRGVKVYIEGEGHVTPGFAVCSLYRAI